MDGQQYQVVGQLPYFYLDVLAGWKRTPGKTEVCDSSTSRGRYTDVFSPCLIPPLKTSLD